MTTDDTTRARMTWERGVCHDATGAPFARKYFPAQRGTRQSPNRPVQSTPAAEATHRAIFRKIRSVNSDPTPSNAPPAITFCVTCRNRLWQLKETLAANLAVLDGAHSISLVDFGSTDGLSAWIWSNFEADIKNRRLTFFEVINPVGWSSPKAKNLAHRLACGAYLFNLDADNRIVAEEVRDIEKVAALGMPCHQWSKASWTDGSYGRIGIPRHLFLKLGGYDETLLPMGGQDIDLLKRIFTLEPRVAGMRPPVIPAIENSLDDKMAELGNLITNSRESFEEINQLNLSISKMRLAFEGPIRLGGYSTFQGKLNGEPVLIDGLNNIFKLKGS